MKVQDFKRLAEEDFPQESRELIKKVSYALNPFLEQIKSALDHNIDFDNLNQAVVSFKVAVNANGTPTQNLQLKSPLKSNIRGIQVIRVDSTDGSFPSGAPFVSFTRNSGDVTIEHITGLLVNKEYNISVILIG